ncbi:MAG: M14 family metallopeptidase [Candidatus Marinimicrobia bacterium]|nr:M14 family metallopeptidase [Candidatus Neomarinimicrobiota bacterium]
MLHRSFGLAPRSLLLLPMLLLLPTVTWMQDQWLAPLPPVLPWSGASEALIVSRDDPWITPSERDGLTTTPTYEETVNWLTRLVAAAPQLQMVSLGTSAEGRDIWMVIASAEGASTPAGLRANGKPTLLAQAGIHAGEIDGKDAGLMLLRDMTVRGTKLDLLDGANLLFVPILSVDGHERSSPYGRINQRGPVQAGWRTNSRNLNLNRDYAKLDTRELRAIIRTINQWVPDLYLDLHVTDGIDYQYDITFGYNGRHGLSPNIARWLDEHLTPALYRDLAAQGHIPGPLIIAADDLDPARGVIDWTASPRFSTGYGDARHLPTVLVENHSLKPYRQRVLGTYVLMESVLRTLAEHAESLGRAVTTDRAQARQIVPLTWKSPPANPELQDFLAVRWRKRPSDISGRDRLTWLGRPFTLRLPFLRTTEPDVTIVRPKAYWIPPAWSEVIDRLALHGIFMERMSEPRTVSVELSRLTDIQLEAAPFEGHIRVTATATPERREELYPSGSVRIPTDQPLGDLAILLLEPGSPDSFFQWGFFLEILQPTEYVEGYVMEPLAQRMLDRDPDLKRTFQARLKADPAFAADPQARLQWFYERTPYFDDRWRLYPVGRE